MVGPTGGDDLADDTTGRPTVEGAGVAPATSVVPPPPRPDALPAPPAPASPTTSGWATAQPRVPRPVGVAFGVAVAVGAVAADIGLRHGPWNNVGGVVFIGLTGLALLGSGRITSNGSRALVLAAVVLGAFGWVRTDPVLVACNVMGAGSLLWLAAAHSRGRSIWDVGPVAVVVRAANSLVLTMECLVDIPAELAVRRSARESGPLSGELSGGVVRGLILASPILLVLGALLASGDAVFRSLFDLGLDVGGLVGHVVLLALGAYAMVVLLRIAGRDLEPDGPASSTLALGRVEALVVLVGLDLLFAVFAATQVVAMTGGAERVLADAGLTFKEYARAGFFQLLWVAGLTLVVLVILHAVTRHLDRRRELVIASLLAIALTLAIVGVAFGRLWLYWNDDGLTPLRFYSSVFSIWIGVVFAILAARVAGVSAERSWLSAVIGWSAVVTVFVLNLVGPERVIVEDNVSRDHASLLFHQDKLSAEGDVELIDRLDRLSPGLRREVVADLCRDATRRLDPSGGFSFNRAEHRLAQRLATLCIRSG